MHAYQATSLVGKNQQAIAKKWKIISRQIISYQLSRQSDKLKSKQKMPIIVIYYRKLYENFS